MLMLAGSHTWLVHRRRQNNVQHCIFLCNAAWPVSSFLFVRIMCSFLLSLSSCTSRSKGQSVHRTGLMISLLKTKISSEDFSISALGPKHRRQTPVTDLRWFALKPAIITFGGVHIEVWCVWTWSPPLLSSVCQVAASTGEFCRMFSLVGTKAT